MNDSTIIPEPEATKVRELIARVYRAQMSTPCSAGASLAHMHPESPGALGVAGLLERLDLVAGNAEKLRDTLEGYRKHGEEKDARLYAYEQMFGQLGRFFAKVQQAASEVKP